MKLIVDGNEDLKKNEVKKMTDKIDQWKYFSNHRKEIYITRSRAGKHRAHSTLYWTQGTDALPDMIPRNERAESYAKKRRKHKVFHF